MRIGTCCPYELGMTPIRSSAPSPGVYYEDLGVFPTSGLTTGMFGLRILNSSGVLIAPGTAPGSCAAPSGGTLTAFTWRNCGAPTGNWYCVLVFENTTIQGVFDRSGHWSGPAAPLENTVTQIFIVSGVGYAGIGYTIATYDTDAVSVSGSTLL